MSKIVERLLEDDPSFYLNSKAAEIIDLCERALRAIEVNSAPSSSVAAICRETLAKLEAAR